MPVALDARIRGHDGGEMHGIMGAMRYWAFLRRALPRPDRLGLFMK